MELALHGRSEDNVSIALPDVERNIALGSDYCKASTPQDEGGLEAPNARPKRVPGLQQLRCPSSRSLCFGIRQTAGGTFPLPSLTQSKIGRWHADQTPPGSYTNAVEGARRLTFRPPTLLPLLERYVEVRSPPVRDVSKNCEAGLASAELCLDSCVDGFASEVGATRNEGVGVQLYSGCTNGDSVERSGEGRNEEQKASSTRLSRGLT